jgi:hypothetical protein
MPTLADLKAEIADDLDRSDLTSAIGTEITRAIRFHQRTRFYFNETRDVTFSTVSGQSIYTVADNASIPKFIEFDQVTLEDGTNSVELDEIFPNEWEVLTNTGSPSGRPQRWTYFNQSIGLFSIPDKAYTVRLIGHIIVDAPTDDGDSTNVWLTEAYDLIRSRVCAQLCLKKLRDPDGVQLYRPAEMEELTRLKGETADRIGTGFVIPSEF